MLRIECPWCGVRDEAEFRFGGPAHVTRPGFDVDDAGWADYVFNRDNPRGWHFERWVHRYGCRQWFNAVRHTVTHEIRLTYPMGASRPEIDG